MAPSYMRGERLLTVEDLKIAYGGKVILRDVNLTVDNLIRPGMQQGQVIALIGPSGVGKTQLFRCLAGLMQPSKEDGFVAGKVSYKGGAPKAGDVGVVFQSYPLLKHRTVWGNLKLAANNAGTKLDEVNRLLEKFGLTDKKDLYPVQLSGGQRQRVAIIQQLLCSSHVVLMDEPYSGLDVIMKTKVTSLIQEVSTAHEENTIIVTTHDIELGVMVADTVWVLGYEKTAEGNLIPGATCIKQLDLIERGLAWNPAVDRHPSFGATVREIKDLFV